MNDLQKTFVALSKAKDWMPEANCRNMDTNLFFPGNGQGVIPFVTELCGTCDVQDECLWYANETHAAFGVFGGMSEKRRGRWRTANKVTLGMSKEDWVASRGGVE
jgi:WhiB family redox-sensing transcriptional regulator